MLEQGGTVAHAARHAGYGSAANFATAFRRRFGLTPRQAREGLFQDGAAPRVVHRQGAGPA